LVVDDEPAVRSSIVRILRGHEVVTAPSGKDAQRLLVNDDSFDLILCDLMMPDVSGVDLHEWLLVHDPSLAKRLVFITGGAFTSATQQHLRAHAVLTLEKPFDLVSFRETIAELVANSHDKAR